MSRLTRAMEEEFKEILCELLEVEPVRAHLSKPPGAPLYEGRPACRRRPVDLGVRLRGDDRRVRADQNGGPAKRVRRGGCRRGREAATGRPSELILSVTIG